MTDIYRAILATTYANKGKLQTIAEMLPMWREGLTTILEIQKQNIQKGEKIGWIDTKSLTVPSKTQPLQRQWKNINNQVNNDLRSWVATISNEAKPLIYQLDLTGTSEEQKDELKTLFILNKTGQWYKNNKLVPIIEKLLEKHPYPNYKNTKTMLMDPLIARFQEPRKATKKKKKTTYNQWLVVSHPTLKPICIPMKENPYLDAQPGEQKLIQFIVKDNSVELRVVKMYSIDVEKPVDDKVIGLDWGLKSILTTSEGNQYGRQLYGWLLERDKELTELTKALQKNNVKLSESKRYRRLNNRIYRYVENEIGRIVNILEKQELKEIVVEELDFRGGGLSKKLNRIMTRAGRKVLKQRLAELSEETGVEIIRVASAYSSQECCSCWFVSRKNRRGQAVFHCKFCGLRLHADVCAGKTVRDRRSISGLGSDVRKETVLEILDQRFQARWGLSFDQYNERSTSRPSSRARGLVPLN